MNNYNVIQKNLSIQSYIPIQNISSHSRIFKFNKIWSKHTSNSNFPNTKQLDF